MNHWAPNTHGHDNSSQNPRPLRTFTDWASSASSSKLERQRTSWVSTPPPSYFFPRKLSSSADASRLPIQRLLSPRPSTGAFPPTTSPFSSLSLKKTTNARWGGCRLIEQLRQNLRKNIGGSRPVAKGVRRRRRSVMRPSQIVVVARSQESGALRTLQKNIGPVAKDVRR